MITTLSWRRRDCLPVADDDSQAVQPLLSTDTGSATLLHLDSGTVTKRTSPSVGRLAVVISGALRVEIGDERAAVSSGEAVRLPATTPHRLSSDDGCAVLILTYPETARSWRVSRIGPGGERWVAGVFSETDHARDFRDRLRAEIEDETIALE